MDIVPQDRCNVKGLETQSDPQSITFNPKPEVTIIIFTNLSISTIITEPPIQPTKAVAQQQYIQPTPSQVWNFDEIGFYPNSSWCNIVCTYKLFTGNRMWRLQTYERSLLCFTVIFTHTGGKYSTLLVMVHQSTHYTRYLHFNIPSDWVVHNYFLGCMDHNEWIKSVAHFTSMCFSSSLK